MSGFIGWGYMPLTPMFHVHAWGYPYVATLLGVKQVYAGRPIPLAEVEVVDARDQPLPHDGVSTGEVVMRSPWLTAGYYREPDKSKEL